jgi:hypothetical protein
MPEKRVGRGTTAYVVTRDVHTVIANWVRIAWVYALSLFACAQAALLGLQTSLGPAFFLPQRVRLPFSLYLFSHDPSLMSPWHTQLADSQGYDYHPPLPDTEAGPLGDCAICMDAIERPPEDMSGKPRRRGAQARASYSLAPCAHLFVSPLASLGNLYIDLCARLAYGMSRAGKSLHLLTGLLMILTTG